MSLFFAEKKQGGSVVRFCKGCSGSNHDAIYHNPTICCFIEKTRRGGAEFLRLMMGERGGHFTSFVRLALSSAAKGTAPVHLPMQPRSRSCACLLPLA